VAPNFLAETRSPGSWRQLSGTRSPSTRLRLWIWDMVTLFSYIICSSISHYLLSTERGRGKGYMWNCHIDHRGWEESVKVFAKVIVVHSWWANEPQSWAVVWTQCSMRNLQQELLNALSLVLKLYQQQVWSNSQSLSSNEKTLTIPYLTYLRLWFFHPWQRNEWQPAQMNIYLGTISWQRL
jgi:hypothetical protein